MAAQLKISQRTAGDVTVLSLEGRLVADDEDIFFTDIVDGLVTNGRLRIVVDMHDVWILDSGGVGTLVSKLLSVRRCGGDIRLAQLTERTRRVLEITRLLSVFQIYESEAEAVRSFASAIPQGAGVAGA